MTELPSKALEPPGGKLDSGAINEQPIDLAQQRVLPVTLKARTAVDGSTTTLMTITDPSSEDAPSSLSKQATASSSLQHRFLVIPKINQVHMRGISPSGTKVIGPVISPHSSSKPEVVTGHVPLQTAPTVMSTSIIRNSHPLPQPLSGHILHSQSPYSHVPRGHAAVANMTPPKSAVATPILRPTASHSTSLPTPSMIRMPATCVPTRLPQSTSLQMTAHVFPKTTSALASTSHLGAIQPVDGTVWTSSLSTVALSKNLHISQSYFKPTVVSSTSVVAQQNSANIAAVSAFNRSPPPPSPAPTRLQLLSTATNSAGLALVSNKASQAQLTLAAVPSTQQAAVGHHPTVVVSSQPSSTSTTWSLATTGTTSVNTIPIAKVHPQPSASIEPMDTSTSSHPNNNIFVASQGATLVLSDNRAATSTPSDGNVRIAPLQRSTPAGSYNMAPSGTYFYEPLSMNHLAMYSGTGNLRPLNAPTTAASNTLQPRAVPNIAQTTSNIAISNALALTAESSGGIKKVLIVKDPKNTVSSAASQGTTTSVVVNSSTSVASSQPSEASHPAYNSNHTSSPRPSILRKRFNTDGISSVKKNILSTFNPPTTSSSHDAAPKAQIQPSSNSHPITSTANQPITNDAIKSEPITTSTSSVETKDTISSSGLSSGPQPIPQQQSQETSPRKKPRKQLLSANELIEPHSSEGEENLEAPQLSEPKVQQPPPPPPPPPKENIMPAHHNNSNAKEKEKETKKAKSMSMLNGYVQNWKTRHNHFVTYSEVRVKEEKKKNVSELANQKGILQKINGWKIYRLSAQMEDVKNLEDSVYDSLSILLNFMENNPPAIKAKVITSEEERILNKISDLIKGNLQRSKLVQDQLIETRTQLLKVFEHKSQVNEIIEKFISKRTLKRKDKS